MAPTTTYPPPMAEPEHRRQRLKVGAVCGKAARPDLRGGREATRVPTATWYLLHCISPVMARLGSAWLRESIPLTGVWHTRDRQRRRQRVRLPRCCGRHTLAASSSLHDPWRDDPRGARFLRMVIRGTIHGAILHRRRLRLSISNTLRGRLKNAPARLVESIPIDRRG
jgi:hypothetical protein